MSYLQPLSKLVSRRDAIQAALDELDKTPIANYGLESRNVAYEPRAELEKQLRQLNRRIAARAPSVAATGHNLADFRSVTTNQLPSAE